MRKPPTEAAVREALGDLVDKVTFTGPTARIRDAYVIRVLDPGGSLIHWGGAIRAVSGALTAAGLIVRQPDAFSAALHVRVPLAPGEVEARQAVEKGYKGKRYRVANEWNLYDHTGTKIGYTWRRSPEAGTWEYRVKVDGLPENPRTYPTLTKALGAVEAALAATNRRSSDPATN